MAKVPSIEEFMVMYEKKVKKTIKEHGEIIDSVLTDIKSATAKDFSEVVKNKVEKDGVSYSSLKRFRESPLNYIEYLTTPFTQTPAMLKGSVLDCVLTTPDKFDETYFIIPEEVNKRSNEGKAIYQLYVDLAKNRTVITKELFQECVDMAKALNVNSDTRYYIDRMKNPQKWFNFVHKESGLKVRGVLDWESEEDNPEFQYFVADLKTTAVGDREGFLRQAVKFWYNGQVGVTTMAYKSKWKFPDFIHIVVENSPPYNCNVFRSSSKYIEDAQREVHNTLMAFRYCLDNNLWNKSYDFVRHEALRYEAMELPGYYKPKF